MQTIIKLVWLAGIFLLAGAVLAQSETPIYEEAACPFGIPQELTITCGHVNVPENHQQPEGKKIRLAIAILKSTNPNPEPDPLLFLQGGPGSSAIEFTLRRGLPGAFRAALAERDVILLDQRGTGLSQPSLFCPEIIEQFEMNPTAIAEGWKALGESLFACRDRLISEGINLAHYTTAQNAGDVAAVREALGYEAINLYGISYGTRLALTVMRDYPVGIRSVILDSTLPIDVDPVGEEPGNTEAAFEQLFVTCAEDILCSVAYPDLEHTFFATVERLNQEPIQLSASGTAVKADITLNINGDQLAQMIFQMMGNPMALAQIPGLIYDVRDEDYRMLKSLLFVPVDLSQADLSSPAAQYSVACADAYSSASPPADDGDRRALFRRIGQFGDGVFSTICQQWGGLSEQDKTPAESAIPVLILAGDHDHLTPVLWAEQAAATLSQSQILRIAGASHALTLLNKACVSAITTAFVHAPQQLLDTACLSELKPEPFAISAAAARPAARFAAVGLGGVAVWGCGQVALRGTRRRKQAAWRMSLRLVGWYGMLGSVIGTAFLLLAPNDADRMPIAGVLHAVAGVVPLVVGIQAAFLFSPDDEPSLEVLLAAPRPMAWLLLERTIVLLVLHAILATIGTVVSLIIEPNQDVMIAFVRWLSPMLFFSGLGAFTTLRSRQPAFGAAAAGLVWFVFGFMGGALLPGQPTFWPLSLVQPFIWPFHIYLQPDDLMMSDYWLNRLVVGAVGIAFLMLSIRLLHDEERVLLGQSRNNHRQDKGIQA